MLYNERTLGDVTFADSRRWQRVTLPDIVVRSGDALTIEVLEIYPGENFPLALSEIVPQGAHGTRGGHSEATCSGGRSLRLNIMTHPGDDWRVGDGSTHFTSTLIRVAHRGFA